MSKHSKTLDKSQINCVIYHAWCPDGMAAALAVKLTHPNASYIPVAHGKPAPLEEMKDKNVLMLDFSYLYDVILQIIELANQFLIIDHHKTAEEALSRVPGDLRIFDMKKSGAVLAWEYMRPEEPLPLFYKYVQDRDIWTNQYEDIDCYATFIFQQPYDFSLWETFLDENTFKEHLEKAKPLTTYKKSAFERILSISYCLPHRFEGKTVWVAYVASNFEQSDLGNLMLTQYPKCNFSAVYYQNHLENKTTFSLRSEDGREDVSQVAKLLGGGGHRNASGCSLEGLHHFLPFEKVEELGQMISSVPLKLKSLVDKDTVTLQTETIFNPTEVPFEACGNPPKIVVYDKSKPTRILMYFKA